jgi:hypothetical protein
MNIPVFLSCPKPFLRRQEEFLSKVENHLCSTGLQPMTLGRTEYSMDAPLVAIRRLMAASFGLITLAFRKTYVEVGSDRPRSDLGEKEVSRSDLWLSSPYCQIEPAMGYQLGLPLLVWREAGVLDEGLLDRGAMELSMPEFNLDDPPDLQAERWKQPLSEWVDRVRLAYKKSGEAPKLW